jgi:hypothetical protein
VSEEEKQPERPADAGVPFIQQVAREIVVLPELESCGVLVVNLRRDGQSEIGLIGAPGKPAEVLAYIRQLVLAIGEGKLVTIGRPCRACNGAGKLKDFMCIPCKGSGQAPAS